MLLLSHAQKEEGSRAVRLQYVRINPTYVDLLYELFRLRSWSSPAAQGA